MAMRRQSVVLGMLLTPVTLFLGVFFLLPCRAFSVFVPEPQMAPGTPPGEMMEKIADMWTASMPLLIVVTLLQMAGTVTMLIVMTDRVRLIATHVSRVMIVLADLIAIHVLHVLQHKNAQMKLKVALVNVAQVAKCHYHQNVLVKIG